MPVVELHLLRGYAPDAKRRLGEAVTDAVRLVVPAAPDAVTVMIHELSADAYMRGREPRTPAPALPDPARTVLDFLAAMERRDLPAAEVFLAEGFEMRFPGSPVMTTLSELLAWSAPRYRSVRKTYAGVAAVSYSHLRAHETKANIVCSLLLDETKHENNRNRTIITT